MKRLKFSCMVDKINDIICDKSFNNETDLYAHMLFDHGFLMPICSTGIDEKLFKDNMELIKQYRDNRFELSRSKRLLKQRLLKSMYGKKINMSDFKQTEYFLKELNYYDNHIHSRIQYIEHIKYDHCRDLNTQLEEKLKLKGIVNR